MVYYSSFVFQLSETSVPILEHSEAKTEDKETGLDVEDVKGDGGKGEGVVEEVESQNLKGGVVEGVKEHVKGEGVGEKVRSDVERAVDEVKGEVDRVAGEVREEKVRELQEAQMADQQLGWLKDSAQVSSIIMFNLTMCMVRGVHIGREEAGANFAGLLFTGSTVRGGTEQHVDSQSGAQPTAEKGCQWYSGGTKGYIRHCRYCLMLTVVSIDAM